MQGEPPALTASEILALYQWADGSCFRCAGRGVPTAVVGSVHPPDLPGAVLLRACQMCTGLMEAERAHAALRVGAAYVPGPRAVVAA